MKNKLFNIILLFIMLLLLFIPTISATLFAEDLIAPETNYETPTENQANQQETNNNYYFKFKTITKNENEVIENIYTNNKEEQSELLNNGYVFNENNQTYTKTTSTQEYASDLENNNVSFTTFSTNQQEKLNEIFNLQQEICKKMTEFFNF